MTADHEAAHEFAVDMQYGTSQIANLARAYLDRAQAIAELSVSLANRDKQLLEYFDRFKAIYARIDRLEARKRTP